MQKGARSRRQIRDHAGSCRRPPSSRGLVGVGLGSKTPSFSLSLYLILTQAVCRSCGTQCPSPRARTKSPRSRTARRSPPFSTSHRQSCSPSLSLCLASVAEVCASSRASWSKKVPFPKFKKISRIRKKKNGNFRRAPRRAEAEAGKPTYRSGEQGESRSRRGGYNSRSLSRERTWTVRSG